MHAGKGHGNLYFTSDVAHVNEEGNYQVIGRDNDVIKLGERFLNTVHIEHKVVSILDLLIL